MWTRFLIKPGYKQRQEFLYFNSYAAALLYDPRGNRKRLILTLKQPHLLLRVTTGHHLLQFLLQLLAGADGLLVSGEVR